MPRTKFSISAEYVTTNIAALKAAKVDVVQAEQEVAKAVNAKMNPSTLADLRVKVKTATEVYNASRVNLARVAVAAIPFMDDEDLLSFILPRINMIASAASATKDATKAKQKTAAATKLQEALNEKLGDMLLRDDKGNVVLDANGNGLIDPAFLAGVK